MRKNFNLKKKIFFFFWKTVEPFRAHFSIVDDSIQAHPQWFREGGEGSIRKWNSRKTKNIFLLSSFFPTILKLKKKNSSGVSCAKNFSDEQNNKTDFEKPKHKEPQLPCDNGVPPIVFFKQNKILLGFSIHFLVEEFFSNVLNVSWVRPP